MNETRDDEDNEPVDLEEIDRQLNANPVINQLNGLELGGMGDDSQEGVSSVIEGDSVEKSEDFKKSEDVKETNEGAEKKDNAIEKNETITEQNEEVKHEIAKQNENAKDDRQHNSPVLTLSDLFSDTASLTRTSSEVPEEENTRLFLLNQQLTSDHPGILFAFPSP